MQDIWCHIHSLMTLRDAARAACVSHAFQNSWKCYPNLIFNTRTVVLRDGMDFACRVDHILKKHSGIGVKTFELNFPFFYKSDAYKYLHRWLEIVVKPGIEKLTLAIPEIEEVNFPCQVLSDANVSSMWYLNLAYCAFRPTVRLGCLRSLTVLFLDCVRITGDELGYIVSSCVALEHLELRECSEITYLKIPSQLQRLSSVHVLECHKLRTIKIEAPNICRFHFTTFHHVQFSLGESLQLKNLEMLCCRLLYYALEELPSIAPNLETFSIFSFHEVVNTTMALAPSKFLHLKYLSISIRGDYDYFSLISFLDAAPSLETFTLNVLIQQKCIDELLSKDPTHLRKLPGYRLDKLKTVKISRFCSSKSLVELTCHILENSASLERLALDTTGGGLRCSDRRSRKCSFLHRSMDAHTAVLVIGKYIVGKVRPRVKLDVVEPCIWCHTLDP
nr:uncharacterized protein LOC120964855 [Aegilops tauschii subsp. strangulata]